MRLRLDVLSFANAISVIGVGLGIVLIGTHQFSFVTGHPVVFAVLCSGVVLSELLPLKIPRRGDDEEITVSSAFAFALLLIGGIAPALIAQSVASVIQDLESRKPLWRTAFNVGQYTIALAAGWLVMNLISGVPHVGAVRPFTDGEMPVVLLGATVFFVVNNAIVGVAVALYQALPLRQYFANDVAFSAMTNGVLLCLAPMIVAAERFSLLLVPMFALPLLALYRAGRQSSVSEHQARHDSLTGLANRGHFRSVAERTIAAHPGESFAVLLMDLNRFKDVNDTLGHHYGDLLLEGIAERLCEAVPQAEVVSRLGGDEFAVLLRTALAPDAGAVAEQITESIGRTIEVGEFVVEGEASIGIAVSPDDGDDIDTLLQRADVAMYRAKETHSNWARYDEEHDHHSPAKLALMGDLRGAIDNGEIVVWYQPALELATGHVGSVEALVRWQHPDLGLLPPGAFLEMAERTSLIKPLTRRVLEDTMLQIRRWEAAGLRFSAAVNVSMRSLLDPLFPQQVHELLARTGVSPDLVKLEITESTIMADPRVARSVLDQLSSMGVSLSIDDFGTGYSSLAYLKDLPVDEVKIDRSFVLGMAEGTSDAVIVRSTIDLGHHLGLQVVAEGVEDEATLEKLRDLRCDRAQGYWISRPLPAASITEWAQSLLGDEYVPKPALTVVDHVA
jgi:diguanylate cyclase (GGDEF)-like protein